MERNFYYRRIADAVAGSANFASLISQDPTLYGLVAAQATAFAALNSTLQSAQTVAIEPTTRTPVAIEARDLALVNMRNSAKLLAKIILATSTVTDVQLVALGLLPRNSPSPVPVPTEPPVVELISMAGRVGKFRVHSGTSPTKRGKPRGCVGANICTYVGQVAPTDADQYQFQGLATRSIVQVQFPLSVPNGSTVRLSACWVTARGVKSFYSSPIVFTIQGGETLPGDSVAA